MFVILQFILVSENPDMLTIEVTKGLKIYSDICFILEFFFFTLILDSAVS